MASARRGGDEAAEARTTLPLSELAERVAAARHALGRPLVLAVDGRSASGKTTLANRIAAVHGWPVVHTDDVAWWHSFFDWWPLLVEHVLVPFRRGEPVAWTPEAWTARGRDGAITVPAAPVLVVEGVSSSRRELSAFVDLAVWVEVDINVAEARGIERDGPEEEAFWHEWQAVERPLLAADAPWERAHLIVDGAPTVPHDPDTEAVVLADRWPPRTPTG